MTDDTTPHDRDRDGDGSGDDEATSGGDANGGGDANVVGSDVDGGDVDPGPNGAGTAPDDSAPDGSETDDSAPDDSVPDDSAPDPIIRDVVPDPSPDARPRADEPEPPDSDAPVPSDDAPVPSDDRGPIPTEVDVEDAFEPQKRTPEAEPADTPEERIVPKRTYCERCEHFERPPDVGCTHEGTRIVEMVDRRQFRVVNCPVVAEREQLAADEGTSREPELDDDEHWRGDVGPN